MSWCEPESSGSPLTLLPLQGDDELLAQGLWLQSVALVRDYSNDLPPTVAHHIQNSRPTNCLA